MDFAQAKMALSTLMTEVVHHHRPYLVRRHRGREAMLLVAPDVLSDLLELSGYRFEPKLTIDHDQVTVELANLALLGFGDSLEEAMEDLVEELRGYARRFFDRWDFYRETDRRKHAPWLLRFALTPPARQLELLYEDSRSRPEEKETTKEPAAATR